MLDLFVCHSSEDHGFVSWLSKELAKKGVTVWVDEGEIRVGDSLIGKIEEGMAKTRFFAVILSKVSLKSPWVKKELEMAITKEVLEKRVIVLPIVIEECEIPLYVRTKRYADFRKSEKKGLRELLAVLVGSSHFQCILFRQKQAAIYIRGYRQRIELKSNLTINYKNEKVPIVVGKKSATGKCFFAVNLMNISNETKNDVKVEIKTRDSTKRVLECSLTPNTQIMSGGVNSNFVSYNIPLLHAHDEHQFEFALNTDEWPEIEIICASSMWDGETHKVDVIPGEYDPISSSQKFVRRE